MRRTAGILLLLTLGLLRSFAEDSMQLLTVELWCELEPMVWQGEESLSDEQAARQILAEAQEIFSAMVYGYRFRYVPADAARKVEEAFHLDPIGRVDWGDPRLKIYQTERRDKRFYARVDYHLDMNQNARRTAWSSNTFPVAGGTGEGNVFLGPPQKQTAFQNSIKEAIRNVLRPKLYNKPREIAGEVLLWEEPQIIVSSGSYRTQAQVKVRITQLVPYRIF